MQTITQATCSVIPPHILRHVAEHGDAEQHRRVAATLTHTAQLTAERAAAFRGAPSAAVPGQKQRNVYDAGRRRVLPGPGVRTFLAVGEYA